MSQRDYMRMLFRDLGDKENTLVSAYAKAEERGLVQRKSNRTGLAPEEYARALYKDVVRKGWIRQLSRNK